MGGNVMSHYDVQVTMSGITTQTNVQQDLFDTVVCDSGSDPEAGSATSTLTIAGGTGLSTVGDETTETVTVLLDDTAVTACTCTPGSITVDQQGRITGMSLLPVAYVYAYLPSSTNTTITTAATYYPITGPFTNGPLIGFSVVSTHLEYANADTRYFEIDWYATVSNDAEAIVHIGVSINSAAPIGVAATKCKSAGDEYALSGTTVVSLKTDDEVQLVITSDDTGGIVTVYHFTTTMRPI